MFVSLFVCPIMYFFVIRELMEDGNLWVLQVGALAVGKGKIIIFVILTHKDFLKCPNSGNSDIFNLSVILRI